MSWLSHPNSTGPQCFLAALGLIDHLRVPSGSYSLQSMLVVPTVRAIWPRRRRKDPAGEPDVVVGRDGLVGRPVVRRLCGAPHRPVAVDITLFPDDRLDAPPRVHGGDAGVQSVRIRGERRRRRDAERQHGERQHHGRHESLVHLELPSSRCRTDRRGTCSMRCLQWLRAAPWWPQRYAGGSPPLRVECGGATRGRLHRNRVISWSSPDRARASGPDPRGLRRVRALEETVR